MSATWEVPLMRAFIAICAAMVSLLAYGQITIPAVQPAQIQFSYEDADWGVAPTSSPRRSQYHAPTPRTVPGARVLRTLDLKALLDSNRNVVVIDVLDSKTRRTIPGAFWLSGAGDGNFFGAEKSRFAAALEKLTGGDKTRPLVFMCLSSECWLSYNASLHAVDAGYKDVIWYRGGTASWREANLPTREPERISW